MLVGDRQYTGRAAGGADKQIAQVMQRNSCDASKNFEWQGMQSCAGAKTLFNGNSACLARDVSGLETA